jgi:hypothetical protein
MVALSVAVTVPDRRVWRSVDLLRHHAVTRRGVVNHGQAVLSPWPTLTDVVTQTPEHPNAPSPVALAALAGAAPGLVVVLLLVLVQPVAAVAVGILVWAGVSGFVWVRSGGAVLDRVGGVGPDLTDVGAARLDNLLASVAAGIGVPKPSCRILEDPAPNALVTGAGPRDVTFVATRGLVDRLDRLQLEAVIAHQLTVVRAGGTRARDVAVTVRSLPWIVGPLAAWVDGALATDAPGFLTGDAAAVGVTRFPPAMLGALELAAGLPPVDADPSIADLWWLPPQRDHLDLRIDHLRELT